MSTTAAVLTIIGVIVLLILFGAKTLARGTGEPGSKWEMGDDGRWRRRED